MIILVLLFGDRGFSSSWQPFDFTFLICHTQHPVKEKKFFYL